MCRILYWEGKEWDCMVVSWSVTVEKNEKYGVHC